MKRARRAFPGVAAYAIGVLVILGAALAGSFPLVGAMILAGGILMVLGAVQIIGVLDGWSADREVEVL